MAEAPWGDDPLAYLATLGEGPASGFDPGVAALAFAARERPKAAFGRYLDHLDQLADATKAALKGEDAEARAAALAAGVHDTFGYEGDLATYDDLQNADMVRVIDRRKGLPVALGILHMSVCQRLDWEMTGLAFPGHFLVSLNMGAVRLPLDPFDGGRPLAAADMRAILKRLQGEQAELTADCYQPVEDRDVLLRLQNNIKLRRLRIGDIPGALRTAEGMLAFAPGANELRREIAMMHMRLDNIGHAISHFEDYLATESNETLRHKVAALLQELKTKLN